ncbi:MAG: hypothetical protein AAGD22_08395 [Verrucomicrobiota bacterium]
MSDAAPENQVSNSVPDSPSKPTRKNSRSTSSPTKTTRTRKAPSQKNKPAVETTRTKKSQSAPAIPIDPKELADHAWEIYLAELAEEGLTSFDDKDCDSLAKRAFEMALVFLQHRNRHHPLS